MPESAEITRAVERGLMRTSDVAAFLCISRQRVDQLIRLGDLRVPGTIAGRRMWDRTEIEKWSEQSWWVTKPWRVRP